MKCCFNTFNRLKKTLNIFTCTRLKDHGEQFDLLRYFGSGLVAQHPTLQLGISLIYLYINSFTVYIHLSTGGTLLDSLSI